MKKIAYGQLLQIKCLRRKGLYGGGDKMVALAMFP
jgi:hypothetical protein